MAIPLIVYAITGAVAAGSALTALILGRPTTESSLIALTGGGTSTSISPIIIMAVVTFGVLLLIRRK